MTEIKGYPPIGTKVRATSWNADWKAIGIVLENNTEKEQVKIKWNRGSPKIEMVPLEDVTLYSEEADRELGFKIQSKIDEAKSAFEKAFKAYQEAQDLCETDMCSLEEAGIITTKELEQVIDNAGWNSSSLHC